MMRFRNFGKRSSIRMNYLLILTNLLFSFGCAISLGNNNLASVQQPISQNENVVSNEQKPKTSDAKLNFKGIDDFNIIAGKRVGLLSLGSTREKAIEYLGKTTEEYEYHVPCQYKSMHWMDYEKDNNNGIFVYIREGNIYQIISEGKKFKTPNGIKSDDDPKRVKSLYPNIESYELLNSASQVNGGANVIYWIDQKQGIGFGIYYYGKINKRLIGSIIVFNSNQKFEPNGCIQDIENWVKRPKWFLGK